MTTHTLTVLLIIAGVLHLGITSAGTVMVSVLDWRKNLAALDALTRHIIWTHGIFVLLMIIGFGVVSITCAGRLASGEPLARAICTFIAAFWALRLLIGFFFFDAKPHLTNWMLTICYRALNCVFVYFVLIYAAAALV